MDQLRTLRTRADEAHFTYQNVPELGDFIDVPFPHESTRFKYPEVSFDSPADPILFTIQVHGPDFKNFEMLSIPSHAHLTIKNGASAFQPDHEAKTCEDRHGNEESKKTAQDVYDTFYVLVEGRMQRQMADPKDGNSIHRFQMQATKQNLKTIGHNLEVGQFLFANHGEICKLVAV